MKLSDDTSKLLFYENNDLDLFIINWLHNKRWELEGKTAHPSALNLYLIAEAIAKTLGELGPK